MLVELNQKLAEHHLQIEVSDGAKEVLVDEGFDSEFGARPLRRAIQRLIENPLSEKLLAGSFSAEDTILIDAENKQINFKKK